MEEERRLLIERKRNILLLISQYLKDNGLFYTNTSLEREALCNVKDYQICDNVDLDSIYLEYMSYYNLKFGKIPKIVKKLEAIHPNEKGPMKKSPSINLERQNVSSQKKSDDKKPKIEEINLSTSLVIIPMTHSTDGDKPIEFKVIERRRLSDCDLFINTEWREMAEAILRDMIRADSFIKCNEIVGHLHAQNILTESTILPLQYPELFSTVGNGWKCTLLHGPPERAEEPKELKPLPNLPLYYFEKWNLTFFPDFGKIGTGKSALAKALFSKTRGQFNFFNVSSSTITSKWRGDSEKFIRVLFDVAKFYAPSIVLFEEIDGLTSCRDVYEHESAKRFKNEFLAQIDGLYDTNSNICILGTTNLPWDIDPAFLRRFEQKLLIGLPDTDERKQLIQHFLPVSSNWSNESKTKLSDLTKGLTGDEIRIACKEATMQKIRQAIATKPATNPQFHLQQIVDTDLVKIFEMLKPTSKLLLEKHVQWSRQFNK